MGVGQGGGGEGPQARDEQGVEEQMGRPVEEMGAGAQKGGGPQASLLVCVAGVGWVRGGARRCVDMHTPGVPAALCRAAS